MISKCKHFACIQIAGGAMWSTVEIPYKPRNQEVMKWAVLSEAM